MKKLLSLLTVLALFCICAGLHAQTTNAAPLVIAPVSQTILAPATGTLTAAQVTALQTQLAAAGITFSGGTVRSIQIVLPPTLTATSIAHYAVTFYPSTHTKK